MRKKAKMGVKEDLSQYDILYCPGCGYVMRKDWIEHQKKYHSKSFGDNLWARWVQKHG